MAEDAHDDLFDEDGLANGMDIAFESMAGIMISMYKALKRHGLSAQEAAALTAAFIAQNMPVDLQGPQDGS